MPEIDHERLQTYKSEVWTEKKCVEVFRSTLGLESVDESLIPAVVKLLRTQAYIADTVEYLGKRYGVDISPDNAAARRLEKLIELLLPWSDPRRVQFEQEFQEDLLMGVLHAKETIEERVGKPDLLVPANQGKLVIPGVNS